MRLLQIPKPASINFTSEFVNKVWCLMTEEWPNFPFGVARYKTRTDHSAFMRHVIYAFTSDITYNDT
jgi:hypothetical protein